MYSNSANWRYWSASYLKVQTAEWHEDFRPFSSREYQPLVADIPMAYASF